MERDNAKIQILKSEFTSRSQRNPSYSIRAFAKHLGISHTGLSLFMNGKRTLSQKARQQISDRLNLDPVHERIFLDSAAAIRSIRKKETNFDLLDLEAFALISDWLHYAILSLIDIDPRNLDSEFCARRLGVSESHAKITIERLKTLGMIQEIDGKFSATGKPIRVQNKLTTSAAKRFQYQLLEKAQDSLKIGSFDEHDFSSITMAIDPKLIPYAREKIRTFRRELCADLESRGTQEEVYNLTVQIYPVSQKVENEI